MIAQVLGVAGNLTRPSKTRALVEALLDRMTEAHGVSGSVVDIPDFGPSLGAANRIDELATGSKQLLDQIVAADALVVASPVYKGSYTGLFKHLFDLIEPTALVGKPVLLAATGGGDRHALVIEHQLRPLFGFFEAATLATGVYAAERDFAGGAAASPALLERIDRAVDQLARQLGARRPRRVSAQAAAGTDPAVMATSSPAI